MRTRIAVLVALLACALGACATDDTPRVTPSAAPGAASAAPEARAAEPAPPPAGGGAQPAPAQAPVPSDPGAAPDTPLAPAGAPPAHAQHTMEEVGAAIEGAIAAAAAVPVNGEDLCGVSYRGLQAMLASLAQAMPDQPTNPLPERDAFLEVCRSMPQEVQQCLVVSYAMEHQEACQQASERLEPAVRARLDAMMNSGAGAAAAP